ncbi:MAG: restriction endonuclease [Dehalococcoidia bacterium]
MARIPRRQLHDGLERVRSAQTRPEKGRALEDFICGLFPLVPGVEIAGRNALNTFATEEVDVALWNARHRLGFYFLPHLVLVECKNWSQPVGTQEVAYFVTRLRQRACDHGILLAANGITGVGEELTRAHYEIATALTSGIRVLVLTPTELEGLRDTRELVGLIKKKLCQLVVSGTTFI